jgi:hypothetical protein
VLRKIRVYLVGVFLGIIMVYFMLIKGKKRDFSFWLPSERVLEELRRKKPDTDSLMLCYINCNAINSSEFEEALNSSEVLFDESNTKEYPKTYTLFFEQKNIKLIYELHKDKSVLKKVYFIDGKINCDCN